MARPVPHSPAAVEVLRQGRPDPLIPETSTDSGRHFTTSAYARNLTNEGYIAGSFGSPPPAVGGPPAEPREWGVRLAVRLANKQP